MRVIVCVEDRGGMSFNGRRVSRDRVVTADIIADMNGKTLLAEEYSKTLFSELDGNVSYSQKLLEDATDEDICFVERQDLKPYTDKITALTVYRWNRTYPWDKGLDITPEDCGLHLVSTRDMEGYSHEKITKEVYEK
jgi:hypothetical protein